MTVSPTPVEGFVLVDVEGCVTPPTLTINEEELNTLPEGEGKIQWNLINSDASCCICCNRNIKKFCLTISGHNRVPPVVETLT